jgi:hypothetical protein
MAWRIGGEKSQAGSEPGMDPLRSALDPHSVSFLSLTPE